MPTLHENKIRDDAERRRQPEWPPPDWYVADSAEEEDGTFVGVGGSFHRDERKATPAPPHREIRY
jgi:hypothetical protein